MRGTRWLILMAILAIIGGVGATYRFQRRVLEQQAPEKPKPLPLGLNALSDDWEYVRSEGGRPIAKITAKKFGQQKDQSKVVLEHVQLYLYHKDGKTYDLVKSALGEFLPAEYRLYAAGEVEITLGVPAEGEPKRTLISIRTSAVGFDINTGKTSTDRPASFVFENGTGRCVGASYDPTIRDLQMNSQVELHWKARGPRAKPMKIETQQLIYRESSATISLAPWARLTRDSTIVEAAETMVTLVDGAIRSIEAEKAHGSDRYPNRQLQYAADHMSVEYSDSGEVQKIIGTPNARLVSDSEGAQTIMTSDRVDMDFADVDGEAVLSKVLATGNGVVESKPLPVAGRPLPETHVLRSQAVEIEMRPGGREIDKVSTLAPGSLEFVPNLPAQHHRTLDGERMYVTYGPRNMIQSFRAVKARTHTDPTPPERGRNRAPSQTSSQDLTAEFDPKTGQMVRMEQWPDFSYQEGDRRAKAARAVMESAQNQITLDTAARLWDSTGSTFADHILLDQQSGNFHARGHVNSSRLPDKSSKKPGSEMLSGDEPLQAAAQSMDSLNRNRLLHYEGGVVLWQGANRVQADRVDIDREQHRMTATGNVVTQLVEEGDGETARGDGEKRSALTIVNAANMVYTEADRLTRYTGGVVLRRPGLNVKAAELQAYLAEQGADSRIEKAFADGKVQIVQTGPQRTRTGTSEHAEYYTDEEKIILRKGEPQLVDTKWGTTRGTELTYFANDDRLLVNGAPNRPATSRIRRK